MDELRKAKSTTVIKRDKEYVTTGVSHGAHDGAVKGADDPNCHKQETKSAETGLDQRVQTSNQEVKKLEDSITAMKELHRKEIEELKTEVEKQVLFVSNMSIKPTCKTSALSRHPGI